MTNIRNIRKSQGKTLCSVASQVGVSIQFLADLERDRRSAKTETLERIADALGVTVDDLKGDDNGKASDN